MDPHHPDGSASPPPAPAPAADGAPPPSASAAPSASAGTHASASSSGHQAHHIAEFGEVEHLVHLQEVDPHADEDLPMPPISRKDSLARHERASRLRRRLFAERHILQYWHNETLYRTPGTRTIGPDELFLDLVIVGGIAALGHELRETYEGWRDVEKFFLLFSAIYMSWRTVILLWNMWGVASDLVDKLGIYAVFTALTFIALGAHGAFDDGVRPYVAVASFLATAIPAASMLVLSFKEPLMKNPNNIVNQTALTSAGLIVLVLPYFAAAFVGSDRATRILYWVPFIAQFFLLFLTGTLYRWLHRNRQNFTRLAVAIELMVEKYDVLTMIVLGESVLGILFEGALLVTADGVRLGSLFGAAAAATAMLYSLQTLYINVDSPIPKGGKHAIRYKGTNGIIWGQLHILYHMALILFATGLGIAMRDIAIPPTESAAARLLLAVRVDEPGEAAAGEARFGTPERWLFSAGWGASIILSGLIGSLHFAGPRAATKRYRFVIRSLVALGIMIGLPFTDLAAEYYLAIHATVLILIALVEYIFVHMDRLGFFTSEATMFSSSKDADSPDTSDELDEDTEESEDTQTPKAPDESLLQNGQEGAPPDGLHRALTARLCKSHCKRLVPVTTNTTKKRKKRDPSEQA